MLMHHQIAGMQVGKALQMVAVGVGLFGAGTFGRLALTKNGHFGQRIFHAGRQTRGQHTNLPGACLCGIGYARKLMLCQQTAKALRPRFAAGQGKDRVTQIQIALQIPQGGLQAASVSGQLLGVQTQQHAGRKSGGGGEKTVQQHHIAFQS